MDRSEFNQGTHHPFFAYQHEANALARKSICHEFITDMKLRESLCETIKKLEECAPCFVSKYYIDDIKSFEKRIEEISDDDLTENNHLLSEIHNLLNYLVDILENNKDCNHAKLNKQFLIKILYNVLDDINLPLNDIYNSLENGCFKLKLAHEKDLLPSTLFMLMKNRCQDFIKAFLLKMQATEKLELTSKMEHVYYNFFYNLACPKFGFPVIKNVHSPTFISHDITYFFFKEIDLFVNQFETFRYLAEQYSEILKNTLEKYNIKYLHNIDSKSMSADMIDEITVKVCKPLNALMKTDDENSFTINRFFNINGHSCYDFSSHFDLLYAWIINNHHLINANKTHFITLPSKEADKLCIYTTNDVFFGVAKQKDIFIPKVDLTIDSHTPLQLVHLMKIDFNIYKHSIINTLLTQALANTHNTVDIAGFILDSHIINQFSKIPNIIVDSFYNLLLNNMIRDQSLKNQIFDAMSKYLSNGISETQNNNNLMRKMAHCVSLQTNSLDDFDALGWLVTGNLFDDFIQILLENKIDVGFVINKYCDMNMLNNYSSDKLTSILTEKGCYKLFKRSLQVQQFEIALKLMQTGLLEDILFEKRKDNASDYLLMFIKSNFTKGVHFIVESKFLDCKQQKSLCKQALFTTCLVGSLACFYELLKSDQIITLLQKEKLRNRLTSIVSKLNNKELSYIFLKRICQPMEESIILGDHARCELFTELHELVIMNSPEAIVSLFALLSIDPNKTIGDEKKTPLHIACAENKVECVKALLNATNIDINSMDIVGDTPLDKAAYAGHTETVKILVADKNIKINRALSYACKQGHIKIVNILLEHDHIDINAKTNIPNQIEKTALQIAAATGHLSIVKRLLESKDVKINLGCTSKLTALHLASKKGYASIVKELIKAGADVNIMDYYDQKPIDLAHTNGHQSCVDILINAKKLIKNKRLTINW